MADLECENRNDSIFYEITITSKEPFIYQIPWKKSKHRYNYRYSIEEIQWVDKVKEIAAKTNTLRIYFNNHHVGKAVINTLQFRDVRITSFV
jgi:uncharacterized protein YecE (DUF72 family)